MTSEKQIIIHEMAKDLKIEDLPEPYCLLAELIGIDNTLLIAKNFSGTNLYLPKAEGLINKMRDKKIKEEFDGSNIRAIAVKYGLTESWVRQIVNKK